MNNDQLNKIPGNIEMISNNITELINNMNSAADVMKDIDAETQPEEFTEAARLYGQSKNELTSYLLTAVDALGLTLLDVVEYVQSSPKAKLWTPESVR